MKHGMIRCGMMQGAFDLDESPGISIIRVAERRTIIMILPELIEEQRSFCEHLHLQWNSSNNSIRSCKYYYQDLKGAYAKATIYNLNGKEVAAYGRTKQMDVPASNIAEAFTLNFNPYNLAFGKNVIASSSSPSDRLL